MVLRNGYSKTTLNDLRAIPPDQRDINTAYRVSVKNLWYGFDPISSEADDGDKVIAPNIGMGRWKAMGVSSSSGGNSGGGDSGGSSEDLEVRVSTLESETDYLFDSTDQFSLAIIDLQEWFDDKLAVALSEVLSSITRDEWIYGDYDSGTNTTTIAVEGLSDRDWNFTGFRKDGSGSIVETVVFPTALDYIEVVTYESYKAEITFAGDVSPVRVFMSHSLTSNVLKPIIQTELADAATFEPS